MSNSNSSLLHNNQNTDRETGKVPKLNETPDNTVRSHHRTNTAGANSSFWSVKCEQCTPGACLQNGREASFDLTTRPPQDSCTVKLWHRAVARTNGEPLQQPKEKWWSACQRRANSTADGHTHVAPWQESTVGKVMFKTNPFKSRFPSSVR